MIAPTKQPVVASTALVIDANQTSRGVLVSQLRDLGIQSVDSCARPVDSRKFLDARPYDVVLCEQHFAGQTGTGNEFLDELRQAGALPMSTVFLIVTGEATYDKVAEAAESALDGYLLKPYTPTTLAERIRHAHRRKRVLVDISAAIERGDQAGAAQLCLARFAKRDEYWMYAGRVGAELLMRLGKHDQARQVLESVVAHSPHPWARLGVARAKLLANQSSSAISALHALVFDHPDCADAMDVLARALAEQGEFDTALVTYQRACKVTPNSVPRLQREGLLSFLMGLHSDAIQTLERSVALGSKSKLFDVQALAVLAIAYMSQKDSKSLRKCLDRMNQRQQEDALTDPRTKRLETIMKACNLAQAGQVLPMESELRNLAGGLRDPSFGSDVACLFLALLAELATRGIKPADAQQWVQALGERFCVSHGLTELLVYVCAGQPMLEDTIRAAQTTILETAASAVKHSADGDPASAVTALMEAGERTLNAKLIDLASMVLNKYRDSMPSSHELEAEVALLKQRFAGQSAFPAVKADSLRAPGALSLRVASTVKPATSFANTAFN